MPTVNIMVKNNTYPIACESGQEAMLQDVAKTLDERIRSFSHAFGKGSDLRLLVLTALMMESEIQELKKQPVVSLVENSVEKQDGNARGVNAEIDVAVAKTMDAIAERIEKIALHAERV